MDSEGGRPVAGWWMIIKACFGRGEWRNEPDRAEWLSSGFVCVVSRHVEGYLRGFVAMPPRHPMWGLPVEDLRVMLEVHRGITFAALADDDQLRCSLPVDSQAELWFVGFDCNQLGDFSPSDALSGGQPSPARPYRNFRYVVEQVERIVNQLVTRER